MNWRNGTISGTPTVPHLETTHTISVRALGLVTTANLVLGFGAPGPFEYISENNTWTKNSYVNIGPSFINITTGNGSTWEGANINSGSASSNPGQYMITSIGDVIYFSERFYMHMPRVVFVKVT